MTDLETDLYIANTEIKRLQAEKEKLKACLLQLANAVFPVCKCCGLKNARIIISNSCDRCGNNLESEENNDKIQG